MEHGSYIEDVAQILDDMRFSAEQIVEQTASGIELLDDLKIPKLNIGEVSLERWVGDSGFLIPENMFKVMENGRKIGSLQIIKDFPMRTLQFRLDIFKRTRYSKVIEDRASVRVLYEILHELFGYFYLIPIMPAYAN